MFVWILLAQPSDGQLYIVGVFGREQYAYDQMSRYLRQHPTAGAMVQRFAVIDGEMGR